MAHSRCRLSMLMSMSMSILMPSEGERTFNNNYVGLEGFNEPYV